MESGGTQMEILQGRILSSHVPVLVMHNVSKKQQVWTRFKVNSEINALVSLNYLEDRVF